MENDYYIGLDIGTNSVGWAVVDEKFDLKRIKGKTARGVRLFDKADTAKERRTLRSSRRRLARRNYRIKLLNDLFREELAKVDPTFLDRIEYSTLREEDKDYGKYLIYTNKKDEIEFYKKYKTIYHLRYALIQNKNDECKDIKLVYLAIHHIIKHRGSFLSSNDVSNNSIDDKFVYELNDIFNYLLSDSEEDALNLFTIDNVNEMIDNILLDMTIGKKEKRKKLDAEIFGDNSLLKENKKFKSYMDLFIALISGGEFTLNKIPEFSNLDSSIKISADKFDNNCDEWETILGVDKFPIIELGKRIYDIAYVKKYMGNSKYFSEAMIQVYDKHHEDVISLKKLFKQLWNGKELYDKFFKKSEEGKINYAYYIEHDSLDDYEEMMKYLKNDVLKDLDRNLFNDEKYFRLFERIDNGLAFRTISNTKNSSFSKEFQRIELTKILENAAKYNYFFKDNSEKIVSIFDYKLKYYEGPLDTRSPYATIVKKEGKENEKILPWNKEEIIDVKKTKNNFINQRIRTCTFLKSERVLPRASILYNDFTILDKLNSFKINSKTICHDIKTDLFDYISSKPKTTLNDIKIYLKKRYSNIYGQDDVVITGIDENSIIESPTRYFLSKDKLFDLSNLNLCKLIDKCINILTIFGDEKDTAIEIIKELFKENDTEISDEQLNCLSKLKCKKRGRLSRKLLLELKDIDDNGEARSIIDYLWEKEENFMIIFNKYSFHNQVDSMNKELILSDEDYIESLPSPIRRGVCQTLKIIKEIIWANKNREPKYFVIEFTRYEGKKERTKSRQDKILDFYKAIENDINNISNNDEDKNKEVKLVENTLKAFNIDLNYLKNKVEQKDIIELLKSNKVYLYFMQLGIDVYTGEQIDLELLLKNDGKENNAYDIDHIFPRHLGGENILDNMVLTKKDINQKVKGDKYPIPESIRCNTNIRNLWLMLRKRGLMNDAKYSRLISDKEVTEEDVIGFTADQLNKTSYQTKAVADFLKALYPDVRIIYSKAKETSAIRNEFNIVKIRELNDAHHAVDAYLNVVSGVSLTTKIYSPGSSHEKIKEKLHKMYDDINPCEKDKFTLNKEHALIYYIKSNNLKDKLIQNCFRHDVTITYRQKYSDSSFYNQKISSASNSSLLMPIHTKKYGGKQGVTLYYGGYISTSFCFFLVGKNEKGKKFFISVPYINYVRALGITQIKVKLSENEKILLNQELLNSKIIKESDVVSYDLIILPYTTIKYNNCYYLVVPNEQSRVVLRPLMSLFLNQDDSIYFKQIVKYSSIIKEKIMKLKEECSFIKEKIERLLVKDECSSAKEESEQLEEDRSLDTNNNKEEIENLKNECYSIKDKIEQLEEVYSYNTNLAGKNPIIFSKKKNFSLLDDIFDYIQRTSLKNDFVFSKSFKNLDEYKEIFSSKKLCDQFDEIIKIVQLFSRNRDANISRITRTIANDSYIVIYSPCGFIRNEIKL